MRSLAFFFLFIIIFSCYSSEHSAAKKPIEMKTFFANSGKQTNTTFISHYKDLIFGILSVRGGKLRSNNLITRTYYSINVKHLRRDKKTNKFYFLTPNFNQNNIGIEPKVTISELATYTDKSAHYTAKLNKRINLIGTHLPFRAKNLTVKLKYSNGTERQTVRNIKNFDLKATTSTTRKYYKKSISELKFSHGSGNANIFIGCEIKPKQAMLTKLKLILKKHSLFSPKGSTTLIEVNYANPINFSRFVLGVSFEKTKLYQYKHTQLNLDLICTSSKGAKTKLSIAPVLKAGH